MSTATLIDIASLSVTDTQAREGSRTLLHGIPFRVSAGERLAIVGESGSGKSTLLRSLIGLQAPNLRVEADGVVGELAEASGRSGAMWPVRRDELSFIPQDPGLSLNPALSIGSQLREAIAAAGHAPSGADWRTTARALLSLVGLGRTVSLRALPRALSGGQRQRVVIAVALAKQHGRLILADEPTSALDPSVQKSVIDTLVRLSEEHGHAVVLVTHDLALATEYFDRVLVLRDGRVRSEFDSRIGAPGLAAVRDDYTRALFGTVEPFTSILAGREAEAERAQSRPGSPLALVEGIGKRYAGPRSRKDDDTATFQLENVSFQIRSGSALALVGESGSGKTTVSRIVLGLLAPSTGRVEAFGRDYRALRTFRQRKELWSRIQAVTQDPNTSMDLRWTGRQVLREPFDNFFPRRGEAEFEERLSDVLDKSGFPLERIGSRVRELSGGERQRLSIARALIAEPRILVLDEPLAALDGVTSLQLQRTLIRLKQDGYGLLYISHDMRSVARIADEVLVLSAGVVRDRGTVQEIFTGSRVAETVALLETTPSGQ